MTVNQTQIRLYPYQQTIALAILDSVLGKKGLTFSVEIARQGGKNEVSAQLELLLLTLFIDRRCNLIKCSPSFNPQTLISMSRLQDRLNDAGFRGLWHLSRGHAVCLGNARVIFLSADKSANVVGNTAHLLLEVDESQDVDQEKYNKDFKPMGATTNCTVVHYGTTWDENTLLEATKNTNLALEKSDGIKRHFRFDWQEVAKYNPDYAVYVEKEKQRLGADHPLYLTQYCLMPVSGGNGLFSSAQQALLRGQHSRLHVPETGKYYVAGVDLAGESMDHSPSTPATKTRRDATVITIGELDFSTVDDMQKQTGLKIVEHYAWRGVRHTDLYPQMVQILKNHWDCKKIVVDATGLGQPVASFLQQALGARVIPFVFSASSKSRLGYELMAAINCGLLKMYGADNSTEYHEFCHEVSQCQVVYRPDRTIGYGVSPSRGHDDYLMSLVLTLEAVTSYRDRTARGGQRTRD